MSSFEQDLEKFVPEPQQVPKQMPVPEQAVAAGMLPEQFAEDLQKYFQSAEQMPAPQQAPLEPPSEQAPYEAEEPEQESAFEEPEQEPAFEEPEPEPEPAFEEPEPEPAFEEPEPEPEQDGVQEGGGDDAPEYDYDDHTPALTMLSPLLRSETSGKNIADILAGIDESLRALVMWVTQPPQE